MSKLFLLKIWKPVTVGVAAAVITYGTRNWDRLGKKLHLSNKSEPELKKIFESIDIDHNGYIDERELTKLLQKEGINLSKVSIKSLMFVADENHDGKIFFEEFLHICHRIQHQEGHMDIPPWHPKHLFVPKETHGEKSELPSTIPAHVPLIKPLPEAPGLFPKHHGDE
jgi:RNA:NAD 2'-phosphotransferase (TPT1/KptA family)